VLAALAAICVSLGPGSVYTISISSVTTLVASQACGYMRPTPTRRYVFGRPSTGATRRT